LRAPMASRQVVFTKGFSLRHFSKHLGFTKFLLMAWSQGVTRVIGMELKLANQPKPNNSATTSYIIYVQRFKQDNL
jgi:hypothetical protein